jgi:type VI protein secretion system component VasA
MEQRPAAQEIQAFPSDIPALIDSSTTIVGNRPIIVKSETKRTQIRQQACKTPPSRTAEGTTRPQQPQQIETINVKARPHSNKHFSGRRTLSISTPLRVNSRHQLSIHSLCQEGALPFRPRQAAPLTEVDSNSLVSIVHNLASMGRVALSDASDLSLFVRA